jgi:hypothetical protein
VAYNAAVWSECGRYAVDYLKEVSRFCVRGARVESNNGFFFILLLAVNIFARLGKFFIYINC